MRPTKIILILFCFSIAFCGCKKEDVLEVYPEMEGYWVTAAYGPGGTVIDITEGKNSNYNRYEGSEIHAKGKATIKGNSLKIGKEEFIIREFPHYDGNGDYSMKINTDVVIKSIAPRVLGIDEYPNLVDLHLWYADLSDQGFTHRYFRDRVQSLDLQYKLQTDTAWTTITNWTAPGINNLLAASTYDCRIKAHYSWGDSEYSRSTTFTTQ
jgi:hypothetical protein